MWLILRVTFAKARVCFQTQAAHSKPLLFREQLVAHYFLLYLAGSILLQV